MDSEHLPSGESLGQSVEGLYPEIHRLARLAVHGRAGRRILEPTELVNELYIRLARGKYAGLSRGEFMALAASVLRSIIVDHARELATLKRGGPYRHVTLNAHSLTSRDEVDVLVLHDALTKLATLDARMARIVELRFFGGMGIDEIARVVGRSSRTVDKEWFMAKAWLHKTLSP